MPTPILSLIEHRNKIPVVFAEVEVEEALSKMIEHGVHQLPIIDKDHKPTGMITYESILDASKNFGVSIDKLHMTHVTTKLDTFSVEDDLYDVLDPLMNKEAVALVSPDNSLYDLLTIKDAMFFLRRRSDDLMLVEDIENMIKDLITFNPTNDDIENFDNLTLGKYIRILLNESTWDFYKPTFKLEPDEVNKLFDAVREIRNHLAHFQGELSEEQRKKLKFCSGWLLPIFNKLQEAHEKSDTLSIASSVHETHSESVSVDTDSLSPIEDDAIPRKSKYAPLAEWLQNQPGKNDRLKLTFEQIEEIINSDLPPSAYTHRVWWSNSTGGHVQSRHWLNSGWRVGYRNMTEKNVTFVRIKERERAYIDFFAKVLIRLREGTNLPIKEAASPDGSSWIDLIKVPESGSQKSIIDISFALYDRVRIELYIDTGVKDENKAIFDSLQAEKDLIEAEIGAAVTWERIDNKKASRVALYGSGSITKDEEQLNKLSDWIFEMLPKFYEAIFERASQAIAQHVES